MPPRNVNPQGIFLNVPFGPTYERRFISLVAALVSIGRQPHCALEISGAGKLRLHRIFDFMSRCRVSIHDLSHVGQPVRFNMPFELGIACALSRFRKPHDFILLECKRHRLDQTLSDIRGWAPFIYRGRIRTLESCIVDSLTRRDDNPEPDKIHRVSCTLWKIARIEKRSRRVEDVFHPIIFRTLVSAATNLCVDEGLIRAS